MKAEGGRMKEALFSFHFILHPSYFCLAFHALPHGRSAAFRLVAKLARMAEDVGLPVS
jgi:hypothetical protein